MPSQSISVSSCSTSSPLHETSRHFTGNPTPSDRNCAKSGKNPLCDLRDLGGVWFSGSALLPLFSPVQSSHLFMPFRGLARAIRLGPTKFFKKVAACSNRTPAILAQNLPHPSVESVPWFSHSLSIRHAGSLQAKDLQAALPGLYR